MAVAVADAEQRAAVADAEQRAAVAERAVVHVSEAAEAVALSVRRKEARVYERGSLSYRPRFRLIE